MILAFCGKNLVMKLEHASFMTTAHLAGLSHFISRFVSINFSIPKMNSIKRFENSKLGICCIWHYRPNFAQRSSFLVHGGVMCHPNTFNKITDNLILTTEMHKNRKSSFTTTTEQFPPTTIFKSHSISFK